MGFTSGCNHPSFSHPWKTRLAHLVALHLLHLGSAQFMVVAPSPHVTANVGQDVVLHCHLSPSKNAWSLDIRWFQHGSAGFVHHYQNGLDLEQMEQYKGRTELLRNGLSNGNLGLRITAVSFADNGSYICSVQDDDDYAEAVVELEVSDPFSQIVQLWKVALAVVVTLLVGSFVIIAFLLRKKRRQRSLIRYLHRKLESKDAMLVEQAERMERKDAMLVKLPPMLKSSDAKLDTLSRKLVEITEKFDIWNSQLKMRYGIMNFHTSDLKNQVAELEITDTVLEIRAVKIVERTEALEEWRSQLEDHCEEMDSIVADLKKHTAELEDHSFKIEGRDAMLEEQVANLVEQIEAFQEPSKRRGRRDKQRLAVMTGIQLHRPRIAQDTKPTISPSQQGNPQQDQEEPVSVLRENPAVL